MHSVLSSVISQFEEILSSNTFGLPLTFTNRVPKNPIALSIKTKSFPGVFFRLFLVQLKNLSQGKVLTGTRRNIIDNKTSPPN